MSSTFARTNKIQVDGADNMDMSKLQEMMGQAQHLQAQMETKLAATTAEASSGGGLVM